MQLVLKQRTAVRMLMLRKFLVNRVQICQSYTEKKTYILARYVRNHSLVTMIYQDIQV
jgi:hypothetical protein